MSDFWASLIPIAIVSFVSAAFGSVSAIAVIRTDIKWIKKELDEHKQRYQTEIETIHRRISRVGDNLGALIGEARKMADDAKELVLKNMP